MEPVSLLLPKSRYVRFTSPAIEEGMGPTSRMQLYNARYSKFTSREIVDGMGPRSFVWPKFRYTSFVRLEMAGSMAPVS
jgi:hypothetical protein